MHHAFLYISLPSLYDYGVKIPNYTFYEGREHATTNFSFSCLSFCAQVRAQPLLIKITVQTFLVKMKLSGEWIFWEYAKNLRLNLVLFLIQFRAILRSCSRRETRRFGKISSQITPVLNRIVHFLNNNHFCSKTHHFCSISHHFGFKYIYKMRCTKKPFCFDFTAIRLLDQQSIGTDWILQF